MKSPKLFATAPAVKVSKNAMIQLNFCLILSIGWHIPNLPIWAIIGAFSLCLWRFLYDTKKIQLPTKRTKFILTGAAFLAILLTFGSFLGRDPGITALALLSSIKLHELKSDRDFMFVVYLCFFLVMGNFLYDQSITSFIFMIVVTLFLISAILRLNQPEDKKVKKFFLLKTSFRFLMQSIPLVVILFLFFPRASGLFWNLRPFGNREGISGFRDRIKIGEVARIARSKETVFRVIFPDNNMPEYKDLYFRGLVLWYTDGKEWFKGRFRSRPGETRSLTGSIRQRIILEPHNRRWLFGLDVPHKFPRWSRQIPGQIFGTIRPLKRHIRYSVESSLNFKQSETLHPMVKRWALQLPRRLSPKILDLAEEWSETSSLDEEVVNAALDFFRNNGFTYTLEPELLDSKNPVEDFLFNTKRGFCEHFATSFALLMRVVGIPARVVVGYQGGRYNQVGEYLVIRQMDAHAWSEVWIKKKGWIRIDPTAVVEPNRIEYGIEISTSMLSMEAESGEIGSEAFRRAQRKSFISRFFQRTKDIWDTIEINWSLWIISYDQYHQWDFLRFFGFIKRGSITLVIIVILLVSFIIFIIKMFLKREIKISEPLPKLYMKFCRKFEKKNFYRLPWEGPLNFKLRAAAAFQRKSGEICIISDIYIRLRYGKDFFNKLLQKRLRKLIHTFKL